MFFQTYLYVNMENRSLHADMSILYFLDSLDLMLTLVKNHRTNKYREIQLNVITGSAVLKDQNRNLLQFFLMIIDR